MEYHKVFELCSYEVVPSRKVTWQWNIHHEWKCISYWTSCETWGFSNVMLIYQTVRPNQTTALMMEVCCLCCNAALFVKISLERRSWRKEAGSVSQVSGLKYNSGCPPLPVIVAKRKVYTKNAKILVVTPIVRKGATQTITTKSPRTHEMCWAL